MMQPSHDAQLPRSMVLAATPIAAVEKQAGEWAVVDANPAFCRLMYGAVSADSMFISEPPAALNELFTLAEARGETTWHHDILVGTQHFRITSSGGASQLWLFAEVSDLHKIASDAHTLSEMKSLFLATMSHEIRTPLQPIYGLLEIMSHQTTDPAMLDTISAARSSASQLLLILDDVLDLAKVEAGKMELDRFEVPLRTLVDGAITTLAGKAKAKNLTFESVVDHDVPQVVMGDPKRLRQILLNLLSNALKFTSEGAVRLQVKAEIKQDSAVVVRFEVIDSGIGLKPEQQEQLFNPFHQADKALSRKLGGTGLGLSICAKLVQLMQGEIGCISSEGKGSTFWFTVPTKAVATDMVKGDQSMPDLAGLLLLSVEDHPQGAKSIQMSLESMGATVDSVATTEEAVQKLSNRRYDLAIIDQGLPDGEGIQLLRAVAKQHPGMGLILYTVFDNSAIQETLKTLGARYLSKPASRVGLGHAVAEAALKIQYNPANVTRVLCIEDTESVQDVLKRQFQHIGFSEYDMCGSGEEAMQLLERQAYGLVICDVHLPEMDGYEIVRRLSAEAKWADMPVIALTADVSLAQSRNYYKHGFKECLLKPISVDQLRRLLLRWGVLTQEPQQMPAAKATPLEQHNVDEAHLAFNHIDIKALEQHYGAFDAEVVRSLALFNRLAGAMLLELKRGAAEQNSYIVRSVAHSLKGSAATAHCPKLVTLAAEVQKLATNDITAYGTLIEEISIELSGISNEVALLNQDALNSFAALKKANILSEPAQQTNAPASAAENPGIVRIA